MRLSGKIDEREHLIDTNY